MLTKIEGMNRRKECVPYALLSYHMQQTRLDVHRTLARVPTVCRNTADDNDNDTLGNGHRADVRRPTTHAEWFSPDSRSDTSS